MSKPMEWDRSLDNPKQKKSRPTKGSSKARTGSFPTKIQREQKKRADAYKSAAESIWKQGKGGS